MNKKVEIRKKLKKTIETSKNNSLGYSIIKGYIFIYLVQICVMFGGGKDSDCL